ncbi:DMT family transporter [Sphingobacterium anhuiense]|uniref:DMT family transporter n=1 Tax=Sphingobacterium anhuiense TaxID=493780 RepID=A0ABW5YU85_9SPHI
MKSKNLFILLLILGTAFWGISFPVTKTAIGSGSSYTFLFYRFFLATIILSIFLFKHFSKIDKSILKNALILAVPLTFGISMQTLGVKMTSASQCAFIAGICVVIIPIIKLVFFRHIVKLKIWLAATVALMGLMIISVNKNFSIGLGDLYTFIGAIGFAVYLIKVEKYSLLKNILPTIVPMFFFCTIIMFAFSVMDNDTVWIPQNEGFWLGILYCSIFSTAYMYTISNISQRYISAEKVAIIYLFEPIFAAVAAYFILDESLSIKLLLGGSLIFIGTLISELKFKKKRTLELSE